MKRSGPLKRTKALARGKVTLKRTPLKVRAQRRPPDEVALARIFHEQVTRGGRCASCGQLGNALCPIEAHHVLEKSGLRRAGHGPEVVWDLRNGMPLCRRCHERHTSRVEPVRRRRVPRSAWRFAAQHNLTWLLEQRYPV
jgi:5-methylcytosine-specific restriction endonuclease McrA